ncbi:GntR family transcriptional regulator [Salinicola avicenniae]|uniref:GntR family transcriptional regulator n=1 Tax=Salinicola avicenniae TaxID=2916836 RepID=UPI00207352DD|nr:MULTISPECIES: GntR family transcriptional regulator [unclassified Salinicola]
MTDTRLPLYQRLRDDMLAKIASGEWSPGGAIPTEAELTKHYGVAVGTLRRAVDTLVQDGLMERSQGRGTFIRRPNFDGSLFRFFRQIDNRGQRRMPTGRVLLRRTESADHTIAEALGLAKETSVIHLERVRQIDDRNVYHEEIWLPTSRFAPLLEVDPDDFGNLLYPFYESKCGQLIASAHETLSVEMADRAIAEVLEIDAGQPVVMIERIARGYDGTPLEYRRSRGDAQTFRYQVDIS